MQDLLYEESANITNTKSASTKYYIFKVFSIISYVLAVFFLMWFILMTDWSQVTILSIVFAIVPIALFFLSGALLGKFKNRMYTEYDYTFITGSVRISKVIKNYKRKNLFKFDCSAIDCLGKVGSDTYEKQTKTPGIKKIILTSNIYAAEGKDFFYMVVNIEKEKKLLIFECTEMFMANVLKFSNKQVLEKDYK